MPLVFIFTAIAGYADAVGYLRFDAFAGMMTGNTVLMGLALFHRAKLAMWAYAAVLGIFFITSAIGYGALMRRASPVLLLVTEAIALLATEIFARSWWAVVPLVMAMGVQNPLASRIGVTINTTFITGDILRFSEGLMARIVRRPGERRPFASYGVGWLGYAIGAALGAAGFLTARWPLILPVIALAYVYWEAKRRGMLSTSGR